MPAEALTWARLDAPGGGWRAYHGTRWRCTVRGSGSSWRWCVERTDADGAWAALRTGWQRRKGAAQAMAQLVAQGLAGERSAA